MHGSVVSVKIKIKIRHYSVRRNYYEVHKFDVINDVTVAQRSCCLLLFGIFSEDKMFYVIETDVFLSSLSRGGGRQPPYPDPTTIFFS